MIANKNIITRLYHSSELDVLEETALSIENGNAVIIPTETLFGLTTDALNPQAVKSLFEIKQRSISNISAVYLADISEINNYALIEHDDAHKIIKEFLPGAVTVVLQSREKDWCGVVSKEGKIGIRVSENIFLKTLLQKLNRPLLATSANISGNQNIDNTTELQKQFNGLIPLIVYDQERITSQYSTVVDLSTKQPILLREGLVPFKKIEDLLRG